MKTATKKKKKSGRLAAKPKRRQRGVDVFSTGQIAAICCTASRTVSKWFDSGKLKGYRIPGSLDRRVPRDELIRFLKAHNMPLGDLEDTSDTHYLLIGVDARLEAKLRELLPPTEGVRIETVADAFDAGAAMADYHPDAILIDLGLGRSVGIRIAQRVRRIADGGDCPLLVALAGEDEADADQLKASGFDEVFKSPFDPFLLVDYCQHKMEV